MSMRTISPGALFPAAESGTFRTGGQSELGSAGGKADIGLDLPVYLAQNGFAVRSALPRIYCVGPRDYMWQWPASFIGIGLARLQELGRIDAAFADKVPEKSTRPERNPNALMITPLVLEIVAEKSLIRSLCCTCLGRSPIRCGVLPLRRFLRSRLTSPPRLRQHDT